MTSTNACITHALPEPIAGNNEGEHIKQGDEKENDERVAQRYEKRRKEVMKKRALAVGSRADALSRVCAEHINTEDKEHHTTDEFQEKEIALVIDEVHHKRHTCTRHQRINNIAERCSGSRNQSIVAPLLHGTLYAKHPYRPHGRRSDDTNEQPFEQKLKGAGIIQPKGFKIHHICKIAIFLRD